MKEEPHPDLGYVLASKRRQITIRALMKNTQRPTEIAEKSKCYQSHISKALQELATRNLVICVNPNDKKGRLYKLTENGKKVAVQFVCHNK